MRVFEIVFERSETIATRSIQQRDLDQLEALYTSTPNSHSRFPQSVSLPMATHTSHHPTLWYFGLHRHERLPAACPRNSDHLVVISGHLLLPRSTNDTASFAHLYRISLVLHLVRSPITPSAVKLR